MLSQRHECKILFQISDAVLDIMMIKHRSIITCLFPSMLMSSLLATAR